jgi:hypothetical protein
MDAVSPQHQLAALEELERDELVARWESVFGCAAPQRCRAPFLRQALAWHLQMSAQHAPRKLSIEQFVRRIKARPATARALPIGSRLAREWQGRTYLVSVTDAGFECDGTAYRSLSAVARAITGTPWSGPLFFGLKS